MSDIIEKPFSNDSLGQDIESGDLGLGLGRKPGGIIISEDERSFSGSDIESDSDLDDYDVFPDQAMIGRNSAYERKTPFAFGRSSFEKNYSSFGDFLLETVTSTSEQNDGSNDTFRVSDVMKKKEGRPKESKQQKQQQQMHKNLKNYIKGFMLRRRDRERSPVQSLNRSGDGNIPKHHGISMGTSMKQERALFETELLKLEAKRRTGSQSTFDHSSNHRLTESDDEGGSEGGFFWRQRKQKKLEEKLKKCAEENMTLKSELERLEEILESKQKAVKIMHSQLYQLTLLKETNEAKSKTKIEFLEKEINQIRFESEYKQGTLLHSQETWSQRFDRVSGENQALMETLTAKSEQVRELHLRIDVLQREKSELLALCNSKDKRHISELTFIGDAEEFCAAPQDPSDWMVLGACKCSEVPCCCARVAAHLRKKMAKLVEKMDSATKAMEDSNKIAEAYRSAMEEQMERGRNLAHQLVVMATKTDQYHPLQMASDPRKKRARHTFKWVIQQLNTDDLKILANTQAQAQEEEEEKRKEEKKRKHLEEERKEMIQAVRTEAALFLAEMLNDLNESLSHQKVVSHLLAIKNQELEAELEDRTEFLKDPESKRSGRRSASPTKRRSKKETTELANVKALVQSKSPGRYPDSQLLNHLEPATLDDLNLYQSGLPDPAKDHGKDNEIHNKTDVSDLFDEPPKNFNFSSSNNEVGKHRPKPNTNHQLLDSNYDSIEDESGCQDVSQISSRLKRTLGEPVLARDSDHLIEIADELITNSKS